MTILRVERLPRAQRPAQAELVGVAGGLDLALAQLQGGQ